MFGFILVGLSLVSMVINLLQAKMKKTYEAGRVTHEVSIIENVQIISSSTEKLKCSSSHEEPMSMSERSLSRSTQTNLSLPGVRQVSAHLLKVPKCSSCTNFVKISHPFV
ncbi:unnamed protein product [Strongylus vulgaris]|uniref:Uncharacterized protein n=1 Tax=Strongylus vulgaris TaxID=40348 RepID=A0A3P7L455_STRVU|nr:unnamed protein product [Strongylus vulgaris]